MREFTELPDGATRFETDDAKDWAATIAEVLRGGGAFTVLTGEGRGTFVGVLRGVGADEAAPKQPRKRKAAKGASEEPELEVAPEEPEAILEPEGSEELL